MILLHLPNCLAQPVLKLGIWTAGLTATAINSALKPAEIAYILNGCKPAAIVTLAGESGLDIVLEALDLVEDKELAEKYRSGHLFTVDLGADDYGLSLPKTAHLTSKSSQTRDWKWLLDTESDDAAFPVYDAAHKENERRAALILWSSGTSGKSKGVILSHLAIAFSVLVLWYGNLDFGAEEVRSAY